MSAFHFSSSDLLRLTYGRKKIACADRLSAAALSSSSPSCGYNTCGLLPLGRPCWTYALCEGKRFYVSLALLLLFLFRHFRRFFHTRFHCLFLACLHFSVMSWHLLFPFLCGFCRLSKRLRRGRTLSAGLSHFLAGSRRNTTTFCSDIGV